MTDDELRAALTAAVRDHTDTGYGARALADALLPVAHAYAAHQLDTAADEAHDEYSGWEAAKIVHARATALRAKP